MCLFLTKNNSKQITATEDITCYKIFLLDENPYLNDKITFISLFQNYKYQPYTLYQNKEKIEKIPIVENDFMPPEFTHIICGGYFHSFANYADAKTYINYFNYFFNNKNYTIIQCIIPKNTKYYKGIFEDSFLSYASKSIYITNNIKLLYHVPL